MPTPPPMSAGPLSLPVAAVGGGGPTGAQLQAKQQHGVGRTLPLRYGCRVLLYRQSMDGYVVATSSAEAPVGLQRDDLEAQGEQRLKFEQAIFVVVPGDPMDASTNNRGVGDLVKYGQTVRLIHQTHQQPLSHHTEQHAVGLKGNLRVLLGSGKGRGSSSGMKSGAAAAVANGALRCDRWRVMPRYRLRVEGEVVADGDPVLFQSAVSSWYLSSAEQLDEVSDGAFLEVSCGSAPQGFQLHIYDADVGPHFKPSVLRCGDCITLLHNEEHKFITADLEKKTCYLRSPESKLAELADEADLVPSLSTTLLSGTGTLSSRAGASAKASVGAGRGLRTASADTEEISYLSTFFVEGADAWQGGAIRTGGPDLYRLKCLSSGLYLQTGCSVSNPEDIEYDEAALTGGDGNANQDAKSIFSGLSSIAPSAFSSSFSLPQKTVYELGLTANPLEPGTVFRIHLASSGTAEYVNSGNRVFLEATNTPNGSLWLFAGGRLDDEDAAAEVTVASLAQRATSHGSMALYSRAVKSMRDGMELRRLPAKAARELQMIRGLLPPLERYAAKMREGVGDPFRVREVRENMNYLRQLCYQRTGLLPEQKAAGLQGTAAIVAAAAAAASNNADAAEDTDSAEALMDPRNRVDGFLNPAWQSKLFQQGVPSLVLRVAEATVRCPYVRRHMLYTADVVQPHEDAGEEQADGGEDEDDEVGAASPLHVSGQRASGSPAPKEKSGEEEDKNKTASQQERQQPRRRRHRSRRRFVPMRYSDLGGLVDTCFDFVGLLVNERPKYAESLRAHVDFVVECCEHMPSALRCLAVLFKNNPVYVELPMAKSRLEFFLSLLTKRGRDPYVLKIVQLFAQCGEESMVEAQRVIFEFFCNADTAQKLLCPVKLMPLPESIADAVAATTSATASIDVGSERHHRSRSHKETSVTGGGTQQDNSFNGAAAAEPTPSNPLSPSAHQKKEERGEAPGSPTGKFVGGVDRGGKQQLLNFPSRSETGEVVMVGLPHSIFIEEQTGDSISLATSTQYRGKGSTLGELLLSASNAEDAAGLTFFPIEGLNAVLLDWPEVKDVFIPYFTEQLMLFASLASGRNQRACQELVFQWIPREVLVLLMQSNALPTTVHGAFVSLFAYAVVDVGGSLNLRQEIRNIRCVITGAVNDRPAVEAYSFRANHPSAALEAAKRYVMRHMATVPVSGDEEAALEFDTTLQLTEALVNGGALAQEEYTELITQLVNTLSPESDDRATYLESPPVHKCRLRALRLLNHIMDVILTRKALELVDNFRNHLDAPPATQLFQFTFGPFLQRVKIATGAPPVEQPTVPGDSLCPAEKIGPQPLKLVSNLCSALMELAYTTDSIRVRRHSIFLYLRMTNYLEELYYVANRVQLLTSEASIGFYADINNTSASIEFLLRKSFCRSNTHVLAHEALDALDTFLSVAGYGAAIEKLAMMRHVGIPHQLLAMLQRLPLPIRESGHRIIFKVVSLLQTMAQDELIHDSLRQEVEMLAPLATQDTNILSLLRTLFIQGASERCVVPFGVVEGVTKCLYRAHSACAAIEFLVDLLSITAVNGHPITQHQQLVWRGIVSDPQAVKQMQFRYTWCSDKGRDIRRKILTSRDYYVSTGRLNRHLGLCHLLYLISVENELVMPEEIRHEVFGLNSIDAMLEVTTDLNLPVFFRKPYVALTETLILDDPAALAAVFAHRSFGEFICLSTMDCSRYLQLLGGSNFFPEVDEDLERREDAAMRSVPANTFERAVDESRFDRGVYEGHVFGPVCGCLLRVCVHYHAGVERLSNRLRSQLRLRINEMVDVLCDLVTFTFRNNSGSGNPWTPQQDMRLLDTCRAAEKEGFEGTSRWRGEPFQELFARFERRAVSSQPLNGLQVPSSPLTALVNEARGDAGFPLGGADASVTGNVSASVPGSPRVGNRLEVESGSTTDLSLLRGKSRGGDSSSDAGLLLSGNEKALTSQWVAFLTENTLNSQYLATENAYLTAAGIVLRTGDRGSSFLRTLFCSLESMTGSNTIRLLRLTRQTVRLAPNNPLDDSVLLPFKDVTTEMPCLTLELSRTARQSLLSRWPGDLTLSNPIPLVSLVSELTGAEYPGVRLAVLETLNTLLRGGHRGMQESYNAYCKRSSNEQLFFILRNHLVGFLDSLRRFHQGILRGSSPEEAMHFLDGTMPNATLELQLIQLLCANQFTALQSYLVAQPDNDISVNLIESLVELLSMGPKVANEVTTPFFLQLLHTISETLQGPCRINQDNFVAYKAADYLTLLLSDQSILLRPRAGLVTYEEIEPVATRRHWWQRWSKHDEEAEAKRETLKVVDTVPADRKERARAVRDGTAQGKATSDKNGGGGGGGAATAAGEAVAMTPNLNEVRRYCMTRIHTTSLSTLLALIEGRQEPDFIMRVLGTVDLTVLGRSMDLSVAAYEALHGSVVRVRSHGVLSGDLSGSYTAMRRYLRDVIRGDHQTNAQELEDELALAVSIFTFFRACYDMQQLAITKSLRSGDGQTRFISQYMMEFLDKRGRSIKQVLRKTESYRRLAHRVGKVEIIRDGAVERVYFRILASTEDNLSSSTRQDIIRNVTRTSDNERIQSFFGRSTATIVEVNTMARMRRNVAMYLVNYCSKELCFLALLLILAMNLTMVIGIRAPTSPYHPGTRDSISQALDGLGIAIICVQGVLLLQALSGPARVKIATNRENWRARREVRVALMARKDMAADRTTLLGDDERHKPTKLSAFAITVFSLVTNADVLEHAFFLFVCVMGYCQHRIWYSIQLLQIMFNSPVLQNLITALSSNIMALILTLVLLIFVIFVFTTISFYFFSDLMDPFGTHGNGFNCFTLSQCLLVHIDNMRGGGGIGDTVDWPVYYSKDGRGYWFTFFRLFYYLLVCLILSNLFLGVIVDSLAQLRQANDFIVVDQEKKCFICGVERNVFDVVQPGTYDTHIEEEHNMWHYIYFLHYLSAKDPSTFTGQEAYVSRLVRQRDVTFFPIGRSIVLASLSGNGNGSGEDGGNGGGGGGEGGAASSAAGAAAAAAAVTASREVTDAAVRKAVDPLKKRIEEMHALLERVAQTVGAGSTAAASPTSASNRTPMPQQLQQGGGGSSPPPQHGDPTVTFPDFH